MSVSRVIEVSFGNKTIVYVNIDTAYYYNDGVIIKPTDGDLPDTYQVHWANSPEAQTTLETIGTSEGVPVPDELWGRSKVIYGWFYLHPTEDSSVTYKEIRIYKSARAGLPNGTEPTPSEHSTIDQLISAMNTAAETAEQNADSASSDADRAETARNEAESYATNAQTSASNAGASATTATNQAQIATTSATTATTASQTATTKATEASNSASSAAESASSASDSAESASRSEQAAKISETNAADSESNASTYANSARGYAQTAQSASASASSSATSASNSANSASNSATSASQSASVATEAKADIEGMVDDAQGYAESALIASQASVTAKDTAQGYAQSASASAQSASGYANNAQSYSQTASAKAQDASGYAQTASQKATEATQSASQALTYKTDAESAKTASQTAQGLAESARDSAVSAKTDAESARDDAETARDEAVSAVASISGALDDKAPVITDTASGAIASFSDGADNMPLKSLIVDINPIQDLHGQDSPYPAGGGKNKLPLTVDGIKALNPNTRGTWTGNSYICRGITYTLITDSDGNIIKIHVSGTRTGASYLDLAKINSIPNGTYIINGGVTSVFVRAYHFNGTNIAPSSGADVQFTSTDEAGNNTFDVVVSAESEVNVDVFPMVRMATESDSTFSPYENICPISGWTQVDVEQRGENLFDEDWESGSINGATGAEVVNSAWSRSKNYIPIKSQVQYYFFVEGISSANNAYVFYYRADKSYISNFGLTNSNVFTPPANCAYVRAQYKREISVVNNYAVSINYPSTDHSYHPYTGRSITIDLGQTVYGGKLDVLSGVLTVDRYVVDPSQWTQYNANNGHKAYKNRNIPKALGASNTVNKPLSNMISEFGTFSSSSMNKNIIQPPYPSYNQSEAYMALEDDIDPTSVEFSYIMQDPLTIQLTPNQLNSLYGVNNLWADSGDTEVEYRADTKLFIERLTAPDSVDMVADANIQSGKYFMVGNSLYKATANIANGAQIIVGTNCIRKSLSEALNEINA